jgi:uncharacterized protein (DUF433 family)
MANTILEAPVPETGTSLRDFVMWQDPERLSGAPCFAGTRVPIKNLFDYIEGGDSIEDFIDGFPGVSREQIYGALRIGRDSLLGDYYEK